MADPGRSYTDTEPETGGRQTQGPDYLLYNDPNQQSYALALNSASPHASPVAPYSANLRVCVGSYDENSGNHISLLGLHPLLIQDMHEYYKRADAAGIYQQGKACDLVSVAQPGKISFPTSKLEFSPFFAQGAAFVEDQAVEEMTGSRQLMASSSDMLRIWDVVQVDTGARSAGYDHRLAVKVECPPPNPGPRPAPLTSFSWSPVEPCRIVTSSSNSYCTIWDIAHSNVPEINFAAHELQALDTAWSPAFPGNVFASCGADGAVKSFDRRQGSSCELLYDSASSSGSSSPASINAQRRNNEGVAILRLAYDPVNPSMMAIVQEHDEKILILDVRQPGMPIAELQGHDQPVNGMAWRGGQQDSCPGAMNTATLATVADDGNVLLWDREYASGATASGKGKGPLGRGQLAGKYEAKKSIESIVWGENRDFLAISTGDGVRCLRV